MMSDQNCIFCKIVTGEIPSFKIYEDDQTLAFMDINPASPGHALVIPKVHAADVYGIRDDDIAAVARTSKRIAAAVESVLKPAGLNLLQCNGPGAAQGVYHFHMHVLPRTMGDELKLNWGPEPGDMDEIKEWADKIHAALET